MIVSASCVRMKAGGETMGSEGAVRNRRGRRAWKAILPILLSLGLLYAAGEPRPVTAWIALALSGAVLWLGRRWIAALSLARIAGAWLAFATVLLAVLRGFGFTSNFWWVSLPVAFLAIVGTLYDLFVWQPHKGRFARARAERRGSPEHE